jgi:hypothetical protein
LSHAPPALAMKTATAKPETRPPASMPMMPGTERIRPTAMGTTIARIEGITISRWAPAVEMATQLA